MAKIVGHSLCSISQDLTAVDDSQRNELGMLGQDKQGNEYVYLQGIASTVVGSVVLFGNSTAANFYVTALSATGAKGLVAIAMGAIVASKFGWYQIRGLASANFNGAAVAGAKLYSASTGKCDDAVVAGDQITGGVVADTVAGSGLGPVGLFYPSMQGLG